jgi:hypothetical protein
MLPVRGVDARLGRTEALRRAQLGSATLIPAKQFCGSKLGCILIVGQFGSHRVELVTGWGLHSIAKCGTPGREIVLGGGIESRWMHVPRRLLRRLSLLGVHLP